MPGEPSFLVLALKHGFNKVSFNAIIVNAWGQLYCISVTINLKVTYCISVTVALMCIAFAVSKASVGCSSA